MELVLSQDIPISFDPDRASWAIVTRRCDAILVTRVLVDPIHFEPFAGIWIVWRDEMEFLGIDGLRVA